MRDEDFEDAVSAVLYWLYLSRRAYQKGDAKTARRFFEYARNKYNSLCEIDGTEIARAVVQESLIRLYLESKK